MSEIDPNTILAAVLERRRRYESGGIDETIAQSDGMFDSRRHAHYFSVGRDAINLVTQAMIAAKIDRFSAVLDLGAGAGRVLRHLVRFLPEATFVACDIDATGIAFCERFGAVPVQASEDLNSVTFARRFDLIWVGSLLTHLSEARLAAALECIINWLEPNGIAIVTLHGRWPRWRQLNTPYGYIAKTIFREQIDSGLNQYGFGYADYPAEITRIGQSHYGISMAMPSWVMKAVEHRDDIRILSFRERAWANHQDVLMLWKNPIAAPPWIE